MNELDQIVGMMIADGESPDVIESVIAEYEASQSQPQEEEVDEVRVHINTYEGKWHDDMKNGCGKLCMGDGTDVDDRWCKYRTLEYCTSSDDLMLTEECYQFCADAENGDLCDNYLQGENGLCKRLNVKTEEDLKKSVGETGRNVSDWCGCMMPTTFYEKHRDTMLKAFDDEGYNIKGQIDLQPECMYPLCKQGSIKTKSQQSRLDNGECTDCVQMMLNKFESPGDINATVAAKQEMSCENIEKKIPDPLIPGYYNLKPSNTKIRVFADKSYCIYILFF